MADAYKASTHAPNDPAVKASYDALKADVDKQYDLAQKLGIKIDVTDKNRYNGPEDLHNDVLNNKHLPWSGGAPPADHPLSEIDPKTGMTYNEKFRAVHADSDMLHIRQTSLLTVKSLHGISTIRCSLLKHVLL